jgi:hypothetical protein
MTIMLACISPSQTSVTETLRACSRQIIVTDFVHLTVLLQVL